MKGRRRLPKVWDAAPPERNSPWRSSAPSAFPSRCRPSRATASTCARRRCPTTANGRRLREASRAFLTPWEPTWPADDLTRAAFRRRLRRYAEDQRTDTSYPFFLFRKSRRRAGRRADARQYPPRRRAGRQPRLLDRRALRAARPDDRRACTRWCRSRSARCGCTGSKRPAFRPTPPRSGLLEKSRLRARGLCARISLHQRAVAGSPAVRAAQRRPHGLTCLGAAKVRCMITAAGRAMGLGMNDVMGCSFLGDRARARDRRVRSLCWPARRRARAGIDHRQARRWLGFGKSSTPPAGSNNPAGPGGRDRLSRRRRAPGRLDARDHARRVPNRPDDHALPGDASGRSRANARRSAA